MARVFPNHVLVLVDAPVTPHGEIEGSPDFALLVESLQKAIAAASPTSEVTLTSINQPSLPAADLVIPLTLELPEQLDFPARSLYEMCRQVDELRQQVRDALGHKTGDGRYWLPVVLTAKGPLYAEVIGQDDQKRYVQPVHLSDRWRQPLYRFANQLLTHLKATPAVYLVQFGIEQDTLVFDRVLPFPDLPAIASLGIQTPDLLSCHWQCLTHQPILDVAIAAPVPYLVLDPAIALQSSAES